MVHGTNPGMVQSALRTRNWMAAGIIGLMVLIAMIFRSAGECFGGGKR